MYINVTKIVDDFNDEHEVHLIIVIPGRRPNPACFRVNDYTYRRFDSLHRRGHHGRALSILKQEGKIEQ